jgi:hypothetical protein
MRGRGWSAAIPLARRGAVSEAKAIARARIQRLENLIPAAGERHEEANMSAVGL